MIDVRYLSPDALIRINERYCGDGAGVRDRAGIEAAAARPYAGYGDHEEYGTIWLKAAALLHGIASTQSFTDGNKRTAFLAASMFLRQNECRLRELPVIALEAFVLAVSTNLIEPIKAAEWLEANRLRASDRCQFAFLAIDAHWHNGEESTFNVSQGLLASVITNELPATVELNVVTRVLWNRDDAFRDQVLRITIEGGDAPVQIIMPTAELLALVEVDPDVDLTGRIQDFVEIRLDAFPTPSSHHESGMIPAAVAQVLFLQLKRDGLAWVRLEINGELLARLPLEVHLIEDAEW